MGSRPLRSWMFVPGNKQRFLDKVPSLAADAVFLDLEDGVPVGEKAVARRLVAEALSRSTDGPQRYVRLNSLHSPWFDDDLATVGPETAGVCLPKVESPDEILALASRLDDQEQLHGMPPGAIRIVAAIESALGLVRAAEIARSSTRCTGLMLGTEDLGLDLGLGTVREEEARELLYARSCLVIAAASAHVHSIDGVFPDLDDPDGLLADIWQARRLGFDAKSTFNPRQLDEINRVFAPQADELDYACRVVAAFDEAQQRGDGSVSVGGQLVDLPIVRRAQRLLALDQETVDA